MQFQSADIVAVQNKVVLRVHGWEPVPGRVDIVKKVTTEIVIRPETARELARNVDEVAVMAQHIQEPLPAPADSALCPVLQ